MKQTRKEIRENENSRERIVEVLRRQSGRICRAEKREEDHERM